MAALLALASALAYGVGDFFGGLSARRMPPAAVILRSQAVGLVGLLVLMPLIAADPVPRDYWVGVGGGLVGGTGFYLFYRVLSKGAMSVVAPITSILSAVVPVVVGLASGERPSVIGLVGIPLALVAVALLAREPGDPTRQATLTPSLLIGALGAGAGFGLYFVTLDLASNDAGLWPVVVGRITSVSIYALVALASTGARVGDARARRGTMPAMLVACGLLDAWANALFLLATNHGMLTLVSVIGALYPATTLLMARTVLGERLARPQIGGVLLAGAAVALVTAG
jgi:drug/metabolite transporter (DMT)-like permease